MKQFLLFFVLVTGVLFSNIQPASCAVIDIYLWGSGAADFTDAEKNSGTADDNYCWAAAASNVLSWTGWDASFSNEDAIFSEFQSHWSSDYGSWARFGWEWWFTGDVTADFAWNALQNEGSSDYSGGGNYYTQAEYDINKKLWEDISTNPDYSVADDNIKDFINLGYGTTLGLYRGNEKRSHATTLWGYKYDDDANEVLGIYMTDSDDSEDQATQPDVLAYYNIGWSDLYKVWYLKGYEGNDLWWIGTMAGLLPNSGGTSDPGGNPGGVVPEPGTILLLGFGLLVTAGISRKKSTIF